MTGISLPENKKLWSTQVSESQKSHTQMQRGSHKKCLYKCNEMQLYHMFVDLFLLMYKTINICMNQKKRLCIFFVFFFSITNISMGVKTHLWIFLCHSWLLRPNDSIFCVHAVMYFTVDKRQRSVWVCVCAVVMQGSTLKKSVHLNE